MEKISRTDGIFPLVTNTDLAPVDVLKKYKEQPYLEKRFNTLKSITEIAPVFLKLPHRIEAMLFLYFIALMVIALIEREIRKNMLEEAIQKAAENTLDKAQTVDGNQKAAENTLDKAQTVDGNQKVAENTLDKAQTVDGNQKVAENTLDKAQMVDGNQKVAENTLDKAQTVDYNQKVEKLPILPQKMKTSKPTWNNIRYFFEQVFYVSKQTSQSGSNFFGQRINQFT